MSVNLNKRMLEDRAQWIEARWPDGLPRACQRLSRQAGRDCRTAKTRRNSVCSPCREEARLIAGYAKLHEVPAVKRLAPRPVVIGPDGLDWYRVVWNV